VAAGLQNCKVVVSCTGRRWRQSIWALSQLGCIGFGQARTPECGVQARAAEEAAAAAAAAAEAEAPVHEENAWGIEVVPAEAGGGGGGGSAGGSAAAGARTGPGEPAEGLEYSMPVRRVVLALSGHAGFSLHLKTLCNAARPLLQIWWSMFSSIATQ
jgi:hypothetical protein